MSEQVDWLRAYALMGLYDGKQVQIELGPGGLMYAVLRGMGPEGLTTVKLDKVGRISAFVIDSSDAWGQILAVGNAELAARLGSLVQYDRRGQVILATDFSDGWGPWRTLTNEEATTVVLDPAIYRQGGYSVKCTGGTAAAGNVKMFAQLPALPLRTLGLSVFFSYYALAAHIDLLLSYDDGITNHRGWFTFDVAAETLSVIDGEGDPHSVATGVKIEEQERAFTYMKLVIDGDNDSYLRVMFNDIEEDLSSVALQPLDTGGIPKIGVSIWAYPRSEVADIIYLDCPIVTINEPT